MATKTEKVRERLTLRDTTDLFLAIDAAIEDHIDEIELNGGELPAWMTAILDEVIASQAERADAIAAKLDAMKGGAETAKAMKERAARREKVWTNAMAALKRYALNELDRIGVDRIAGNVCVLRRQTNSAAAVTCALDAMLLLGIADDEAYRAEHANDPSEVEPPAPHPLARFITVTRSAALDTRAVAAAYQARERELTEEAATFSATDLPDADFDMVAVQAAECSSTEQEAAIALAVRALGAKHVRDTLEAEFPGITCVRGSHLRVD